MLGIRLGKNHLFQPVLGSRVAHDPHKGNRLQLSCPDLYTCHTTSAYTDDYSRDEHQKIKEPR
jgi:hypothetical protein